MRVLVAIVLIDVLLAKLISEHENVNAHCFDYDCCVRW